MNSRTAFIALALAVALAAAGGRVIAEQGALKSGLDPAQFDKTVRPQDDLFRYVNGGWLAKTEIPAPGGQNPKTLHHSYSATGP